MVCSKVMQYSELDLGIVDVKVLMWQHWAKVVVPPFDAFITIAPMSLPPNCRMYCRSDIHTGSRHKATYTRQLPHVTMFCFAQRLEN